MNIVKKNNESRIHRLFGRVFPAQSNPVMLWGSMLAGVAFSIWFYSYFLISEIPHQNALLLVSCILAFMASGSLVYFLTLRVLQPFWRELSLRSWRWGYIMASVFFGIVLLTATIDFKYASSRLLPFLSPIFAGWIIPLILTAGLFVYLSSVVFAWASSFKGISAPPPRRAFWKELLLYLLPMILAWGFQLMVFFPGRMSTDSFNQWNQMVTWKFVDWHPPIHTLTNWLVTRIWFSPAAVSIFQIAALALAAAWFLVTLRRVGAPAWLTWIIAVSFALAPANGTYAITLWKDVLFSVAVLALAACVLNIWVSRGRWLESKAALIGMSVIMALAALY